MDPHRVLLPVKQLLLGLFLIGIPGSAYAQGFDLDLLKPAPGGGAHFATTPTEVLSPFDVSGELLMSAAFNPLRSVFVLEEGQVAPEGCVLTESGDADCVTVGRDILAYATLRMGIPGSTELDLSLPFRLNAVGKNPTLPVDPNDLEANNIASNAAGDLRLTARYRASAGDYISVAMTPFVSLPTGSTEDLMGSGRVTGGIGLAVAGGDPSGLLHWAANAAYWERFENTIANADFGRQFRFSGGVDARLLSNSSVTLRAGAELLGAVQFAGLFDAQNTPLELLGGVHADLGLCGVRLGVGTGISPGVGVPQGRILLGANCGAKPNNDSDGDGILSATDRCPTQAEDKDGFQDKDGCPDPDNDRDGVLDVDDKCPGEPEDIDKFEDKDGCPDIDTDDDGLSGTQDKCPEKAEDKDGFEDDDGCPDPDNDKDGVKDEDDKCPKQAEDRDNFRDDDGCPDIDNDADELGDEVDKCPYDAETYNGIDDTDGCADGEGMLDLVGDQVEFRKPFAFKKKKKKLSKKQKKLLPALVGLMQVKKDAKLRIEVHTSDKGKEKKNLKLSQTQANAVRKALIKLGMEEGRVVAKGMGSSKPLVPTKPPGAKKKLKGKNLKKARAKNRRVEFWLEE